MHISTLQHAADDYDMDMEDVMRVHDNYDDNDFYEKLEEFCRERLSIFSGDK